MIVNDRYFLNGSLLFYLYKRIRFLECKFLPDKGSNKSNCLCTINFPLPLPHNWSPTNWTEHHGNCKKPIKKQTQIVTHVRKKDDKLGFIIIINLIFYF